MTTAARWVAVAFVLCSLAGQAQAPEQRTKLVPRLVPGAVLVYQSDFRVSSQVEVTGPLENPQAPKKVESSVGARVRLEVLDPPAGDPACAGCSRLRVTYEKVAVTTKADIETPEMAENEASLKQLEGKSVEFTLAPGGKIRDVRGSTDIVPDEKKILEEWFVQLAWGAGVPAEGVVPGQKWSAERPVSPAPLLGIAWKSDFTYVRNEPCRAQPAGAAAQPAEPPEMCAVVLAQFAIVQHPVGDPTPEEYRVRGLRTSGKFSGAGESLIYVSLASGWVVSVTQHGDEEMDLTLTSADDNSPVHYVGRVQRQSSIALMPAAPASPK